MVRKGPLPDAGHGPVVRSAHERRRTAPGLPLPGRPGLASDIQAPHPSAASYPATSAQRPAHVTPQTDRTRCAGLAAPQGTMTNVRRCGPACESFLPAPLGGNVASRARSGTVTCQPPAPATPPRPRSRAARPLPSRTESSHCTARARRQLLKAAAGRPSQDNLVNARTRSRPAGRPAAGRFRASTSRIKIPGPPGGGWCRPASTGRGNECLDHGCEPGMGG